MNIPKLVQYTMCCLYSTMALWYFGCSKKHLLWENNFFEAIFPMCSYDKTLKLVLFFSPAIETLFLEHSKSVKIARKSQI